MLTTSVDCPDTVHAFLNRPMSIAAKGLCNLNQQRFGVEWNVTCFLVLVGNRQGGIV